jgi:hypothetical protein
MRDESSPDAAALIRAGRAAFRPDAADRARVLRALEGTLGEGALRGEPGGGKPGRDSTAARHSLRAAKVWSGLAALAVASGVLVSLRSWTGDARRDVARPSTSSSPAVPSEPASSIAPSSPASPSEDLAVHEPARAGRPSSAPRSSVRPATSRATSDSLKEEVRLLSRAERQLGDGLGEDALATLDEHEQRFPRGALTEERMVARVEALCMLARMPEAKAEMGRLVRAYPTSLHLNGAARRFCGDALGVAP